MEAPAPPPVIIPSDFKTDKIMGVLIMVVAGLSALAGLFAIFIGSVVGKAEQQINAAEPQLKGSSSVLQSSQNQSFPDMHIGLMLSVLGWVAVGIALLQLASGIGMFKGSRKGLIFALGVAALSIFGGVFGIILGVAIALYTILRLWGNVGPRPV